MNETKWAKQKLKKEMIKEKLLRIIVKSFNFKVKTKQNMIRIEESFENHIYTHNSTQHNTNTHLQIHINKRKNNFTPRNQNIYVKSD